MVRTNRGPLLLLFLAAACSTRSHPLRSPEPPREPEAISLLGKPLHPPPLPEETRRDYEAKLEQAREQSEKNPNDPDALIWLGRRTAYLGRYRDAIALFSEGVEKFPDDPRFYRHRGHRYITTRQLDLAVADLEKARALIFNRRDEFEPDGIPNERNIPTSTLNANVWYHLGLAYYLKGDFESALPAYRDGMAFSKSLDMLVATSYWLTMTLRRLGQEEEARKVLEPIREDMDIIENKDYHRLLLMYQGKVSPESLLSEAAKGGELANATVGYGVANWHLSNGRREEALRIFRRILEGEQWAAFGYIAAEAEVQRLGAVGRSQR